MAEQPENNTAQSAEIQANPEAQPNNTEKEFLERFDRFYDNINGILAAKENFKLKATFEKLNKAYYAKWSIESNKHLRLVVILSKRRKLLAAKG